MFDVGAGEMLLVVLLAIMLYGGDLPDVARKAGAGIRKLRGVADDLKRQVQIPPEADLPRILREADPRSEIRALDPRPAILALDDPRPAAPAATADAPAAPPPPQPPAPPPDSPPAAA
jgi:Sec-independent protein translocase protein TatA